MIGEELNLYNPSKGQPQWCKTVTPALRIQWQDCDSNTKDTMVQVYDPSTKERMVQVCDSNTKDKIVQICDPALRTQWCKSVTPTLRTGDGGM